jgi:glycosyltransferase involved in cell wall biosynthesis
MARSPIPGNRPDGAARKLLLIANTSWYLWNFRAKLAERLRQNGCEITFAAPPDAYSGRLAEIGHFVPLKLNRKGRNPLTELFALLRVYRLLRAERPDYVLTWTPKPNIYTAFAGRFARIPVTPNVAGLAYAFTGDRRLARIVSILYRVAFERCKIVFFQNNDDRHLFVEGHWVEATAARLLPGSGVDLDRFRPQPPRDGRGFVFLFIGRLIADKGLPELISAARQLKQREPGLCIRIAGFSDPGNPTSIDESTIRKWETEGIAEYLGSTDEVRTIIAAADCVVLPSYYREGTPRTLLEAAACARPIITTDAPGCRDVVIEGETGFLCRPRDVTSLAEAMRRMMTLTQAERETMGRAGRAYMERSFSEEIVIAAYERALSEIGG